MSAVDAPGLVLRSYAEVHEAFRHKELHQALYDEGSVVMADVLLCLHGDAHRARRRLENRLFRRDTFVWFEREVIPPVIDETFGPAIAAGAADVVPLVRTVSMNMTAAIAGVDRPAGTAEETADLYRCVVAFSEGATLVHSTLDRDHVRARVQAALDAFDEKFLQPSIATRRSRLGAVARGEADEADLPRDVLTVLLRNQDRLDLPPEVLRREVAFYLQAGSHSTVNATTHVLHELFGWMARDPSRRDRLLDDPRLLQRGVHEGLRLHPASPVARRRPADDIVLRSGRVLPAGTLVEMDLMAANRDTDVFGADAHGFDPERPGDEQIPPWGLTFGGGVHACIGEELDGGVAVAAGDVVDPDRHVNGTVTTMCRTLLAAGARPDPDRPPVADVGTSRANWSSYPVRFG